VIGASDVLSVVDSYLESVGTVVDEGGDEVVIVDDGVVVVDDDKGMLMMQSSMSMQHQQHRMLLPFLQRRWPELIDVNAKKNEKPITSTN